MNGAFNLLLSKLVCCFVVRTECKRKENKKRIFNWKRRHVREIL